MNRKIILTSAAMLTAITGFAATFAPPAAQAQAQNEMRYQPPLSGVLSLTAQASEEVKQDFVTITLFYEQEASDPASLSTALNQRADVALQKAKGVAGVSARSGQFSIAPSTNRDGRISAWRGRTEVILESHDFTAASKLAGSLTSTMQVGNVQFSLSPQAQRAAQQKLSGEAIASFRSQAAANARAFGYNSYTVRAVNIESGNVPPRPLMLVRNSKMASVSESEPLPLAGGTSTVTVNVSGSVQMR